MAFLVLVLVNFCCCSCSCGWDMGDPIEFCLCFRYDILVEETSFSEHMMVPVEMERPKKNIFLLLRIST